MKIFFKAVGGLFLVVLLGAGLWIANVGFYKPYSIDLFYNRVFVRFLLDSPELVTSLAPHPLGIRYFDRRLSDASVAQQQKQAAFVKSELDTLHAYDRAKLDAGRQLSYDILEDFLATTVAGEPWLFHSYPLNPTAGEQSELPSFLLGQHPIDSAADVESFLARLNQFGTRFDQILEGLNLREARGIRPPKFVVDKTLKQMREFIAKKPEENVLYVGLSEKLAKLDALDDAARKAFLARTAVSLNNVVYPAYGRLIENFEALAAKVTENNGVWSLPDGAAYYAWCVRQQTTSTLSPDAIHDIGLAEVARIEAEMNTLLVAQGYAEGSVGARVAALGKEARFRYVDGPGVREQVLADYQSMIDTIDAGLGPYFNVRPTQPVKVERIPVFKEKTSPGAYYQPPALDGSRPGVFFANLRSVQEIPRFSMRTLAYHEGIPGHHFQLAIQQKIEGVPTFRKLLPFTAYSEGWALYSEKLAAEIGFQPTPLDDLGRLQAEMFRAVRLVVDSGLHHKRWTREQAIDYMVEKTGMAEVEATAEIERYLVWPGQALGYKLGMLKILELRERAKTQLGDQFDLKEFHRVVLTPGSLPLPVLEAVVDRWLATKAPRS
jgi:uncharacterized protein (DUF885 family)